MIRLTIYRIGSTVEIDFLEDGVPFDLESSKIYTVDHTANGKTESIKIRPYYRRTVGDTLNIFAEEESE